MMKSGFPRSQKTLAMLRAETALDFEGLAEPFLIR